MRQDNNIVLNNKQSPREGGVLVAERVRLLKSDQRKLLPIRGQKHANSPRRSHCSGFELNRTRRRGTMAGKRWRVGCRKCEVVEIRSKEVVANQGTKARKFSA